MPVPDENGFSIHRYYRYEPPSITVDGTRTDDLWPLDDAECYFNVTNSSGAAVDITINATNFSGGVGWTLTSGSPGENTVRLRAGKSGDANENAMVVINGTAQSFISSLADSTSKEWEVKLETGTFTDGILKEATIVLTASLS